MLVFKIKEKFWSWGDSFTIYDKDDKPEYVVKGKAFSWGDKLSFRDVHGRELAFISQKLLSFKQKYEISVDGKPFAELTQAFSWFSEKFTLDVPGPNDYIMEGSFLTHKYTFLRKGRVVAEIDKDFWGWTDSYGVSIVEGEDVVAILCSCIVVDQILEKGNS